MIKKIYLILNILLLSSFIKPLHAFEYEKSKLEIFSKLIPRIVLMSSLKNNIDKNINICFIREAKDNEYTDFFKEKLENNPIKNIQNQITTTNYTNLQKCENTNVVFMFNTNKKTLINTVGFFKEKQILTVSYNPLFLKYGVNMSLFFGTKVLPYLNVKSIIEEKIILDNILLRISKIYSEDN